jgi:hypothetical protein
VSEALRLADELERYYEYNTEANQAAAELRRLAAVEQELEALKRAISEAEPVAWMWEQKAARSPTGIGGWDSHLLFCHPSDDPYVPKRNVTPLYTLKGIK